MTDTSGHDGFDAFVAERFAVQGVRVLLRPDPMGGRFTQAMTPEQAEHLARQLFVLAAEARRHRGIRFPDLYPEDA